MTNINVQENYVYIVKQTKIPYKIRRQGLILYSKAIACRRGERQSLNTQGYLTP